MESSNPVKILKDKAEGEKGEVAHLSSFLGATAIDDSVKSTLGSEGMDRILIICGPNSSDIKIKVQIGAQVTNDNATISKNVALKNRPGEDPSDIPSIEDIEERAKQFQIIQKWLDAKSPTESRELYEKGIITESEYNLSIGTARMYENSKRRTEEWRKRFA